MSKLKDKLKSKKMKTEITLSTKKKDVTRKKKEYTEDSFKFHKEDVDKVRKRPSMYMGSNPIFQCCKEVVDNSIDEANENQVWNKVWDILIRYELVNGKHTFLVADKGRGIPVGIHEDLGISTLTGAFTQIQGGGKFDSDSYEAGKGTNGCGVCATNALSEKLEVWTYRDGWHYQSFKKGKPTTDVISGAPEKLLAKNKIGTVVKFTVDNSIEQCAVDTFSIKDFKAWLTMTSLIDSPVRMVFEYPGKKGEIKSETYHSSNGAIEYLKMKLEEHKLDSLGKKPFSYSTKFGTVVCQWASTEETIFEAYTNGVFNKLGGTHLDGFYDAVVRAFNSTVKNKKKELKKADLQSGLVGFINIRLAEAQYSGQVKDELKSPVKKKVSDELVGPLTAWFSANKGMTKEIFNRAFALREARTKAKELMKAATSIKGSKVRGSMLPGILVTCDPKCPIEKRELFIVEGESAGGPAKDARDRFFQEVMCLTGKPINALKSSLSKVLASEPIQNMLIAAGVDPVLFKKGIPQNPPLRVGRIIMLPDGDNDGAHIGMLISAAFYRLVPSVIEKGMLYIVDAPLYSASSKSGEKIYGYTLKEIQAKAKPSWTITRMKGWGECPRDDLADIAFDLAKRKLLQIKPPTKEENMMFSKLVGEDVSLRKKVLGIDGVIEDAKLAKPKKTKTEKAEKTTVTEKIKKAKRKKKTGGRS